MIFLLNNFDEEKEDLNNDPCGDDNYNRELIIFILLCASAHLGSEV